MALCAKDKCKYKHSAILMNISFLVVLFIVLTTTFAHLNSDHVKISSPGNQEQQEQDGSNCQELRRLKDYNSKCIYLKSHSPCVSQGYINYLQLFYCNFGRYPALGYSLFGLWLLVLFYLLGNTASDYFCSALEGLSAALQLPPAIAGVTLLSLGNGAPDVFASVVSFAAGGSGGGGAEEVGISSVLGGALFISTVVAGVVSIAAEARDVTIDRRAFVRDLCFLLLVLCYLLVILVNRAITLWSAISFLCLYVAYVFMVWASHYCRGGGGGELQAPLLANSCAKERIESSSHHHCTLPLYANPSSQGPRTCTHWLLLALQMPLYLPRRLTIPDAAEARWSKPYAVASAALSPMLLATIWNTQNQKTVTVMSEDKLIVFLIAALVGIFLAILAMETTEASNPPKKRKFLLPWLAGGFLMSVIWSYMTARELVAVLVTIGYLLGIRASILGVTVLAWGNSLGDLVSDVAMALHGGPGGVHVAVSGCYAGPLFNTVVGLGLSLTLATWAQHPAPFELPLDPSLFQTLGFLGAALLWAFFVLPLRGMRLDRVLGFGLLGIYLCFLGLRICESLGILHSWNNL